MSKQNGNKGRRFDRAFKEEAVRLLQTSGRRQRQIAGDLGVSVSEECCVFDLFALASEKSGRTAQERS